MFHQLLKDYDINQYQIILASGSKRRQELLTQIGVNFQVIPSNFEENLDKKKLDCRDYCEQTAYEKAKEVFNRIKNDPIYKGPLLIIGSDTIIEKDNTIIEKPKDREDAVRILNWLQGSKHNVITGLTLICRTKDDKINEFKGTELTEVIFDELDNSTIESYVDSKEPMDKAGGYGIQSLASLFIREIKGDYYTVVGFPINLFFRSIKGLLDS